MSSLETASIAQQQGVTGHSIPTVSAESFAAELLRKDRLEACDVLRLSLGLPSELPDGGSQSSDGRSVSVGLRAQGHSLFVREVSLAYPLSTKVFARFVKQICPDFVCTTLSVFTNLKTPLHSDVGNCPFSKILLFPLNKFSGGGVWFESPGGRTPFWHQGQQLWGTVLDVSKGLCFLDTPRARHATLDWSGSRSILVGWSVGKHASTEPSQMQLLYDAGFPLPKTLVPLPALGSPMYSKLPLPTPPFAPLFVELFAGCARLSRCCSEAGFRCLAIDSPWNKHKPEHPIFVLDLADESCQQILLQKFSLDPPAAVHCALPCGTGSRAREKPISKAARRAGAPQPRPLRDAQHVLGLPGLSQRDTQRVQGSNMLCQFVIQLLAVLPESCFLSIENPLNSWIWGVLVHFVRESRDSRLVARWKAMIDVVFDNCMKGGRRPKKSRFRCTHSFLTPMAVECDGSHEHLPYETFKVGGRWEFSTAQEAEYPQELCSEFSLLLSQGLKIPPVLQPPSGSRPPLPQPRRAPRLLPEFLCCSDQPPADGRSFKALSSSHTGSCGRIGWYRFPLEFLDCAMQLQHPFDVQHFVPDQVKRNIFAILTQGHAAFAGQRLSLVKKLSGLQRELQYEEARFHSVLPDHVREVIKGKSVLMWIHLLKETGFEDHGVFDLMKGVDLVGTPDKSPLFGLKEVAASSTSDLLLESSGWRRERLKARNPHEDDSAINQLLWDHTIADVEDGFLAGPFDTESAVREHLHSEQFVASRRFLIEQGTPEKRKFRAIDDYRQGGVNEAYNALEKLALFDVNCMTAVATYAAKVSDPAGDVVVALGSGEVLRDALHCDFKGGVSWMGRTLDLSKAYRQVPLSTASLPFGVVMVNDPSDGRVKYFAAQSLPFGATSSVFAFNRISRSLLHLGWHLAGLVAGCFYDDYP